jgi:hypothetical protein
MHEGSVRRVLRDLSVRLACGPAPGHATRATGPAGPSSPPTASPVRSPAEAGRS